MKAKNVRALVSSFALVVGLVFLAAPAFAQVAFTVSSLPQQARFEGLSETMGAVQATNNGASGVIKNGSSVTVLYSGGIVTNTLVAQNTLTCSGLGLGAPAGCGPNITVGSVAGGQLTISFSADVTVPNGAFILVSQVRVNVNALGAAATTVTATLSGTSAAPQTNPLTFTNATVPVASVVNPSLTVAITAAAVPMQTCSVTVSAFTIAVTERYPAALATGGGALLQENGFTSTSYTVNNGTSVIVAITGVPAGLSISAISQTGPLGVTTSTAVQTSTGPTTTLTWSFPTTSGTTNAIDTSTITFNVGVLNSTPALASGLSLAALGSTATLSATVSLGPIQAASTGIVGMAANTQGSGAVATIGDCVTNLLFPFMTNQVGFDTTFAISNTTSDDLAFGSGAGATAQSGTCNLVMYPIDLTTQTSSAAGSLLPPSTITTPIIGAGGTYVFSQSSTSFAGKSGYLFAICRFLDAHGFSYVVNGTATTGTISQGLLALVIQNTATRLPSVNFENLAH